MANDKILVGVVMGSASDKDVMKGCPDLLRELGIGHEVKILSAHRTPELTRDYALSAEDKGIEVLIAGAGWAAHLAGVLAAHTTLPVIGVPIDSSAFQGLDALLSTVQQPTRRLNRPLVLLTPCAGPRKPEPVFPSRRRDVGGSDWRLLRAPSCCLSQPGWPLLR